MSCLENDEYSDTGGNDSSILSGGGGANNSNNRNDNSFDNSTPMASRSKLPQLFVRNDIFAFKSKKDFQLEPKQ